MAINLTKLDNLSGVPLLTVLWCDDRDNIPPGFGPSDGQLLPRSVFPDAFTRISNSPKRVVSDAAWLADPLKRGKYTLGDGSTNFRVPDLNGKQPDSIGALYLRGDGKNAGSNPGDLQGEMIGKHDHNAAANGIYNVTDVGKGGSYVLPNQVFLLGGLGFPTPNPIFTGLGTDQNYLRTTIPNGTTTENRPVSATGCFIIKLFGAVIGEAQANIAQLATDFAVMASRVSILEQRKSTCLVNAIGTGAPHETVVPQLPVNIAVNSRYVIPNPFGNTTPVVCWVEVFVNNKWSDPGFIYADGTGAYTYSHGVTGNYVQGEGIVVQTGLTGVCMRSNLAGGGHGATADIAAAPCRVFVHKLD